MSQFKSPPDVEPLSELSWKRIEQRTFGALELGVPDQPTPSLAPSRKGWWIGGGLAACACAAALALVAMPDRDRAPSEVATHSQRSRVTTQETGSEVVLGDATIDVSPESAIWLDSVGDEITVTLDRGGVRLKVAPRDKRAPVAVLAGKVRVEVVGTEFAVYRSGEDSQVVVYEGVVSVIADGKREEVSAGESWPSDEADKKARRRRARKHRNKHHLARKSEAAGEDAVEAPSSQELFEEASTLESTSPEAAIAIYQKLSAGDSGWAANALYAHARLELARGNEASAERLLTRYLSKHPAGANAEDARELLGDE